MQLRSKTFSQACAECSGTSRSAPANCEEGIVAQAFTLEG